MKRFMIGFLVVMALWAYILLSPSHAQTLVSILENASPVELGTCYVPDRKVSMMIEAACQMGVRANGNRIWTILDDGAIVAVYEQFDDRLPPVKVWDINWREA